MSDVSRNSPGGALQCPHCHRRGRAISAATLEAMVPAQISERLNSTAGFQFCATSTCDVVYFHATSPAILLQRDLLIPVFQKSSNPNRVVCYCFGHTVQGIQSEVREKGFSHILEQIKDKCAQGLERCERTNPQGSCCLGNVQRVLREAGNGSGPLDSDGSRGPVRSC